MMRSPKSPASGQVVNKKVEFSPTTLGTIDSEGPITDVHTKGGNVWDTETDHILSYFLGGDPLEHPATAAPDFASTNASHLSSIQQAKQEDSHLPPPTPQVQFYAKQPAGVPPRHKGATGGSPANPVFSNAIKNSSSSSLTSMAASLVSGVPPGMLYNNQHRAGVHNADSPISPAAMIGTPENMLLPPAHVPPAHQSSSVMAPPERREPKNSWPQPTNKAAAPSVTVPPTNMMQPLLPAAPIIAAPFAPGTVGTIMPAHHHVMYTAAHAANLTSPAVESEEKRAKRLERNRMSARKSRRKKKERLLTLGDKVNKLHGRMEVLRRKVINDMVPALKVYQSRTFPHSVQEAVQACSLASSPVLRSVLDFQYTSLKLLTLPSYQKLILWFTLQADGYFLAGKENYNRGEEKPQKVSSKQIGEELFNKLSKELKKQPEEQKSGTTVSTPVHHAEQTWPLFCYELKFSVDQEERFVATHKQVSGNPAIADKRAQMVTAANTAESLGKAVGSLGHVISQRQEQTYGILSQDQANKFQAWRSANAGRLERETVDMESTSSLNDICRKLDQVLQISNR